MAKTFSYKQLKMKKFKEIPGLDGRFLGSFGQLSQPFVMIAWGQSSQGKSNFIMQILRELRRVDPILYLSLEEGMSPTLERKIGEHLGDVIEETRIKFTDHTVQLADLRRALSKKRSAKLIVVDSLQYFGIHYPDYKHLRADFPRKSFIFVSHAKGRMPDGKTADKIRYDADIKVRVEGKVAFIDSRFGGNKPWIIWPDGAKNYWGEKFKEIKKQCK